MHLQRQLFSIHGELLILILLISTIRYQLIFTKITLFHTPEYQPGSQATFVRTVQAKTNIQCVSRCLEDSSCTTVTVDKAMETCNLFANGISPPSHPASVVAYSLDDQVPACGNSGNKDAYLAGAGRTTFACADGWTVIQNREKHNGSFNQTYHAYIEGFGDLSEDFWWGLERLHTLTSLRPYTLCVEMEQRVTGNLYYEEYTSFEVKSAADGYELVVSGASGNAGDAMAGSNGMKFSSYDRDQDAGPRHCGKFYSSGWWFSACFASATAANLNGPAGQCTGLNNRICIIWLPVESSTPLGLQKVRMMIK